MRALRSPFVRALSLVLTAVMLFSFSAFAADDTQGEVIPGSLSVQPSDESGIELFPEADEGTAPRKYAQQTEDLSASDACYDLIVEFEGFSATTYSDGGNNSIGYGTALRYAAEVYPEIAQTRTITEEQAEDVLHYVIENVFSPAVNQFLKKNGISVNQNQFDALISFTFNVGTGWMTYKNTDGTDCLLKQLLLSDPALWTGDAAEKAFGTWVYSGGTVLPGLVRRRAAEAKLFSAPLSDGVTGSNGGQDLDDGNASQEPKDSAEEIPGDAGESIEEEITADIKFSDVSNNAWYYEEVMKAAQLKLMIGIGEGNFAPDKEMTRAELVQAVANFAGADLSAYKNQESFEDVPLDAWYAPAVAWASGLGIVKGTSETTFDPTEPVTREQACCIIYRYLTSLEIRAGSTSQIFNDDAAISSWANESVYACVAFGIIYGMDGNRFGPKESVSRCQFAAILVRAYSVVYG